MSILPIIYTQRHTETSSTGLVALLPFRWVREHKNSVVCNDNSTSLPIWWWPWKPVTAQQLSQLVSQADRDQPESHTDDEIITNKTSSFNLEGGRMALEVTTFWRPEIRFDSILFLFWFTLSSPPRKAPFLSLAMSTAHPFHLFLFLSLPISSNSPYFPLSIPHPSIHTLSSCRSKVTPYRSLCGILKWNQSELTTSSTTITTTAVATTVQGHQRH